MIANFTTRKVNAPNVIKDMIWKKGNVYFPQKIYKDQQILGAEFGIGMKEYVFNVLKDGHSIRKIYVSQFLMIVKVSIMRQESVVNVIEDMILLVRNV